MGLTADSGVTYPGMSRRDPFEEERRKHRSKDGPGRARGRGWYWGGYWGAPGNMTGYMGEGNVPPEDMDHLGDQFNGIPGADAGSATGSAGDAA